MGNKVTLKGSDSKQYAGKKTQTPQPPQNNIAGNEVGLEVTEAGDRPPEDRELEEIRRRYLEIQERRAREEEQRKAEEEARVMLQRREEEVNAKREEERQLAEQRRNNLGIQERQESGIQESEEEQLALALAISQSEAEVKDREAPPARNTEDGLEEDEALALALTISRLESEDSEVSGAALSSRNGPSQRLQPRDGLSEELQCPVCLEMFRRATTLGCGHTFCADCLQEVLTNNGDQCPLCRALINSATHCVALDNVIQSLVAKE